LETIFSVCLGGKPTFRDMSKLPPNCSCRCCDQVSRSSQSEALDSLLTTNVLRTGRKDD
jgi:hypothetical protein